MEKISPLAPYTVVKTNIQGKTKKEILEKAKVILLGEERCKEDRLIGAGLCKASFSGVVA